MKLDRCAICRGPAHASTTDDYDRCAQCRPKIHLVARFDISDCTLEEATLLDEQISLVANATPEHRAVAVTTEIDYDGKETVH